jgi:hypothetical protein
MGNMMMMMMVLRTVKPDKGGTTEAEQIVLPSGFAAAGCAYMCS